MKSLLIFALTLSIVGCHKQKPDPECAAPDAGPDAGPQSPAESPCAGKAEGAACCLGAVAGRCESNRCVAGAP